MVGARSAAIELGRQLPDTPEAVVEVARMLADIGEMNQARWMLEEAVARHPGNEDLVFGLAETSIRVGDAAAAFDALDMLPTDTPRAGYGEILRAQALVLQGRLDEALSLLVEAGHRFGGEPVLFRAERIQLLATEGRRAEALAIVREMQADPAVPASRETWLALQESDLVLMLEGRKAALELLDPIVEAHPGSVEAAQRRTSILIVLGRADEALADLRAALSARPHIAALNTLAAEAAIAVGDLEAAERHLRRHAEMDPSAATLATLAHFLHQQGRTREAAAILVDVPAASDPVQRIELRYEAIAMQIEANDLDEARSAIEAFRIDHPHNPRLDYLLARLDLAEDRPEDAARRLVLVVARLDRSDVKHLLGVALERSGDLQGAEVRYGIVTLQGPSQIASWAGLLRTLEGQQKWEQLASAALTAARIEPLTDTALQSLARARIALGQLEEAELVLREHMNRSPELVGPRVGLAVALRRQGRADEALQVLEQASDEHARDAALIAEQATVLGSLGRVPEALELLETAQADGTSTPALRHAGIYLRFAAGRGEEALIEAARVTGLDPSDPVPHRMAADYLASVGRFEESIEPYRRTVELVPSAGDVVFRMAIALERAGHDAEAIEAYRQTTLLDETAVGARNNLALLLARNGELREALLAAQAAYARAETDPVVMDTLASLYLEAGVSQRAAAMLEKAHGLAPGSDEITYHLALAYRDTGRSGEARQLLSGLSGRPHGEHVLQERIEDALRSLP